MPDEIPGTPAPPEPATPAPAPAASDADVAQNYFDNEITGIHQQLDEMKQSIAHLLNAQEIGRGQHAGSSAQQSGAGTPAGQSQQAAISAQAASSGGQQVGGTAEAELEPEHAPAPSHWYWRSLRGG